MFEDSGNTSIQSGGCTYNLVAYWDIVGGTYSVLISGDCHCSTQGSAAVTPAKIGTYWISFTGSMRMHVDPENKAVTFEPLPPSIAFDVQCNCNRKVLDQTWTRPRTAGTHSTGNTTTGVTPGTSATTPPRPPPPPLPARGRSVCKECTDIQNQIDADWQALDEAERDYQRAVEQYNFARNNQDSHSGMLEDFKKNPSAYDTTEARINERLAADKAAMDTASNNGLRSQAAQRQLRKELRELGSRLEDCIKKCGHASMHKEMKHSLIKFGVEKVLEKHHRTDSQDEEERRRREQEQQNVSHDDDPYH